MSKKSKQSENTNLFYSELWDWIQKGFPKHPFFSTERKIFANAVIWDSQDMATAKDVMRHSAEETRQVMTSNQLMDIEIMAVLMLRNGNYYKSPKVISFIKKHLPK